MNLPLIKSEDDLTDDAIAAIAGYAQNLSYQNDEVIQTIGSSDILNPDVQKILDAAVTLDIEDQAVELQQEEVFVAEDEDFGFLMFPESALSINDIFSRIKALFTGLRKKVRRLFCQVVATLQGDKDLDLKQIIKAVLVALIPALAGATGLIAVALPIVISLAAMLIKYGMNKVCPV